MEMHTVHLADKGEGRRLEDSKDAGPWASAVGIMFDRTHYDPTITAEEK
jgi:hypothetical protein